MDEFDLEKYIWTSDEDFAQMGWHDCPIYAVAFPPSNTNELWLDIDYLFHWVRPTKQETYFQFWVAPSTLVFENVRNVNFRFEHFLDIEVDSISRDGPVTRPNPDFVGPNAEWSWLIQCHTGSITLNATGFSQYVRSKPVLNKTSQLGRGNRIPYSFAQDIEDE
ncbi:MAG: hypothetical protein JST89_20690 [Cyanobacteria bacterium SZAS-4]|nr:hypothetical protein [Cyanobacteria bacterium SZAS-4]